MRYLKKGFMVFEALITCCVIMIAWYSITASVVQAIAQEKSIERTIDAVIFAASTLDELRRGKRPLKTQEIQQDTLTLGIQVLKAQTNDPLCFVNVRVRYHEDELLCLKTALVV